MADRSPLKRAAAQPRLLVVGPLPPPPTGTSVSFQLFCREVASRAGMPLLEIIDSSPGRLKDKSSLRRGSDYLQAIRIIYQYAKMIRTVDKVLVFGSQGFLLVVLPVLRLIAKLARKRCYVRPFGGALDRFLDGLNLPARRLLLATLRSADGLIVETELLRSRFSSILGDKVVLAPGYRIVENEEPEHLPAVRAAEDAIRLVFLGIVREDKGVFVLLDSLRRVAETGKVAVVCDFFGSVSESVATRFHDEIARNPSAEYLGVLDPDTVIATLRSYDALIHPTYYRGEGQPGVLIEAMMAGLPVVTTNFRSIPELVVDGDNGLLVPPMDVESLAAAIERLAGDAELRARMGLANWNRRSSYDIRRVVPQILRPLGIGAGDSP